MSKARQLADLGNVYDDGALSNRNLIINGAMQVAQRGTSETGVTTTGYHTCDRWQYREASGISAVSDHEQISDAPTGFKYSYKVTCTTADAVAGSENAALSYKLEGYDTQRLSYGTSSAKQVTLSFWVKSNVTGTYGVQFYNGSSYSALKSYTINTSATWEYKTITLDGDVTNALPDGSAQGFSFLFHLATGADDLTSEYDWTSQSGFRSVTGQANVFASTSNYWQITGVQLEVGDTATPFEHEPYSVTLQKAQRYYQTTDGVGNGWFRSGTVGSSSSGNRESVPLLGGQMRATPSITASYSGLLNIASGYPTVGQISTVWFNNNVVLNTSNAHFRYEVYYNADAEL